MAWKRCSRGGYVMRPALEIGVASGYNVERGHDRDGIGERGRGHRRSVGGLFPRYRRTSTEISLESKLRSPSHKLQSRSNAELHVCVREVAFNCPFADVEASRYRGRGIAG